MTEAGGEMYLSVMPITMRPLQNLRLVLRLAIPLPLMCPFTNTLFPTAGASEKAQDSPAPIAPNSATQYY